MPKIDGKHFRPLCYSAMKIRSLEVFQTFSRFLSVFARGSVSEHVCSTETLATNTCNILLFFMQKLYYFQKITTKTQETGVWFKIILFCVQKYEWIIWKVRNGGGLWVKSEAVNLSGPTQQFFQLKKPPKKSAPFRNIWISPMLAKSPNLDFGVPRFCPNDQSWILCLGNQSWTNANICSFEEW